ncbi:MAG: hypothetical protein ABIG71_02660 [Candidatus Uhrbacteria bacterium]
MRSDAPEECRKLGECAIPKLQDGASPEEVLNAIMAHEEHMDSFVVGAIRGDGEAGASALTPDVEDQEIFNMTPRQGYLRDPEWIPASESITVDVDTTLIIDNAEVRTMKLFGGLLLVHLGDLRRFSAKQYG